VDKVVHMALDCGMNFFDTAEAYNDGASEESLGVALKGRRSEAVIGTKLNTSNVRAHDMAEHCEASLRRLGTDYIDVYMLHWPVNKLAATHFAGDSGKEEDLPETSEVFKGLKQLQDSGKIRWIGVSNHGLVQMREIEESGVGILVNELPYNLISRAIEKKIAPYCVEYGIGVIGYMSMQQGILAGIYDTVDDVPPAQAHSRHFSNTRGGEMARHFEEGAEDEITALLGEMKRMSGELGVSVPRISLAYALAYSPIACTLVGSRNKSELLDNIETEAYELPEDALAELNKLSDPILAKLGDSPDYYENRKTARIF
jgi:aryl-alcohol dehydrogenase-like predicted oxidoreductase